MDASSSNGTLTRRAALKVAGLAALGATAVNHGLGLDHLVDAEAATRGGFPPLPAKLMPGSPHHAKGWTTSLPPLPAGYPRRSPITITATKVTDATDIYGPGDSLNDNNFTRLTRLLFGIQWKVKWTWTGNNAEQKYNLALASGDLPDFMSYLPLTVYSKMLQANKLEDITEAWDKYASPRIKKALTYGGHHLAWSYAEVTGRKMGIPPTQGAAQNDKLLWIRQDWLDKVGMHVPTTVAEVEAVAKAFVKARLGGLTTYGLNVAASGGTADFSTWYSSLDPIFGGFGVMPTYWTREGTGLMYDSIRPRMLDALVLLRRWYQEGIIPRDYFTLATADSEKRIAANQAGMMFSPSFAAGFGVSDSQKLDPRAHWIFADIPRGPVRKAKAWWNPYLASVHGIRKGFPYVRDLIQQMNWWQELFTDPARKFRGWEGQDYVWQGNTIVPGPLTRGGGGSSKQWIGPIGGSGHDELDPLADSRAEQYLEAQAKLPAGQRDAWVNFQLNDPTGVNTLSRRAYLFATAHSNAEGIKNLFNALPTPTMVAKGSTLQKLEDEAFTAIITGNGRASTTFQTFVSQWKRLGGDKITHDVNEWWARSGQR